MNKVLINLFIMSNNSVFVPGSEWPKTEWDIPGVWYKGTIQRQHKGKTFVKFDGEDEEIDFTRERLQDYQELYGDFKFSQLYRAAESVFREFL